ncbi:magnesium chelatase subunit H [Methylobacterium sp. Leaf466]|uniref:magnesium chelatase subunit H n=1 Tax=Methylobacterium sp. Leaf466 TaxID=1736386 RepID=UPI0006F568DA|nr:magnesium chelatase subunit H [Methylobacterium sp. Leaf466]KQT88841.1 magnesium chelatase [Methylobacterium sp. Leaf466]
MQKRISVAEPTPVRIVIVTMDTHLASAVDRARRDLQRDIPGLTLVLHAATEFGDHPEKLARCRADIAAGDIVICAMLFMEDHFQPIIADLRARRDHCDAMLCMMSASEVTKLTRVGAFSMDGSKSGGAMGLLKRLRGAPKERSASAGAEQMKMLKRLPKILRFIPGTAQDVRAYFLTLQYWLAGSDENVLNMIRALVDRYASGERKVLRGRLRAAAPVTYPEVGVYHPRLPGRMSESLDDLPSAGSRGTVGVLGLRSYMLAGNAAHYDGVIAALEARGLRVITAFASGLDSRPAIERYFLKDGVATIDAMVSLTGFSLVGGPAYNDARAAEEILAAVDVPYVAAYPAELQTLEQWGASERGLLPVETTIMVAIPELDGATGSMLFGGRSDKSGAACKGCHVACVFPSGEGDRDMHSCVERAGMLAARVDRLVRLRRSERAERKVGIVIFNFPPNAGNTGTAAYLSVFESLFRTLAAMKAAGYAVEVPESVDDLRERVVIGNAARFGAMANVHTRISVDTHVRRERHLAEIEAQWGPAPGKQQSDGSSIFVLGAEFGNIFVGIQPAFGYEGDPMRLLFEKGFAPTHAFSAFYRWLRDDFKAHALLHFGTHGALEFMPGRQSGLSATDWPDRLIGDMPNLYLYAANNPSEGTIAKRRSSATLISYLTPPIAHAGLYRGLLDVKGAIERWRGTEPEAQAEREDIAVLIQAQAALVDLAQAEPAWGTRAGAEIARIGAEILDLEYTLIPHGLHVVGEALSVDERIDMLLAMADSAHGTRLDRASVSALVGGATPEAALSASGTVPVATDLPILRELAATNRLLTGDSEVPAILRALDARFIRPAPGGDLLRTPSILPTGRNLHGFDPFRIPSAFAVKDGAIQAQRILDRHKADGLPLPKTVAIVLWGTDNLKNEGGPIGQVLALLGTRPRFDGYGRLTGAELIPLAELGRPRIDVVVTLSGIFRDLLPLQIKLLAEACLLAATADEPVEQNFVRLHALAYQRVHGGDMETASLRVFGNAEGAYGSNVNHLVENGRWEDEDELADTYARRKGFAYGRDGRAVQHAALLKSVLADVDLAYQNLDSVELGVTTVDHYFDTLGGISRAVKQAKGGIEAPVYIGDQTRGEGCVRSLSEQVAIETRTRILNPKWYEGMLAHGYEGVRQIETHLTNTVGWSATTSQVEPWVYKEITSVFVLDPAMRERMAALNPTASAKVAQRLIEAHRRGFWTPDAETRDALDRAEEELEDRLEGITTGVAA